MATIASPSPREGKYLINSPLTTVQTDRQDAWS